MNKDRLKELAARGGKSAHASGKAHKFTSEQGRDAGVKGLETRRKRKTATTA